jgi:hypothetical protein
MREAIIKPKPPFNFDLLCKMIDNEFNGKEVYENAIDNKSYYLVLNVGGAVIPLIIDSNRTTENPVWIEQQKS